MKNNMEDRLRIALVCVCVYECVHNCVCRIEGIEDIKKNEDGAFKIGFPFLHVLVVNQ